MLVGKWLPYRPMLIPLTVAWREIANATGPDQGAMRAKLIRWFWCACFTGEYESSSATLAERDSPVLRDLARPAATHHRWSRFRLGSREMADDHTPASKDSIARRSPSPSAKHPETSTPPPR